MRPHGDTCAAHNAQASDVRDSDNYSVFVVNYYPKTEGITWKPDTNRITPHTDETLVTLLFTSPGALHRPPPCLRLRLRCPQRKHRQAVIFAALLRSAPALALTEPLCVCSCSRFCVGYWQHR